MPHKYWTRNSQAPEVPEASEAPVSPEIRSRTILEPKKPGRRVRFDLPNEDEERAQLETPRPRRRVRFVLPDEEYEEESSSTFRIPSTSPIGEDHEPPCSISLAAPRAETEPETEQPYLGFREPLLLTYSGQDEKESLANHFLRDICRGSDLRPLFNKEQDTATILPCIKQSLADVEQVLEFVHEEQDRLSKSLEDETRAEVRLAREKLMMEVDEKIGRLEGSQKYLIHVEKLAEAGLFEDLFKRSLFRYRDLRDMADYRIRSAFGEFPRKGQRYLIIDGSWEELL